MLACLDDAEVSSRLAGVELSAPTPRTQTAVEAIKGEVEKARAQGYALMPHLLRAIAQFERRNPPE